MTAAAVTKNRHKSVPLRFQDSFRAGSYLLFVPRASRPAAPSEQWQEAGSVANTDTVLEHIPGLRRYARAHPLRQRAGTRRAMIYAWRHPDSVHRSVMIGANPPVMSPYRVE